MRKTKDEINLITGKILDAAIEVHKNLGPGLLESVYDICLNKELFLRGLHSQRQVFMPVIYKSQELGLDFRLDILVEDEIVVELKSIEVILPVHESQIITYLKLADKRVGQLINFNVPKLIDGFKRFVNHLD